ncbi:MAG: septal ring lytic transglycosylase RlpA family protein [Pseudomonadota bacterium]
MERKLQIFMIGLVALLVLGAGCAKHHAKKPYPAKPETYSATGQASWYGPGFSGRKTASGERFRPSALTAAHRSLPFGTMVEVTNLANNRTVVVRINDRGPYAKNRIIDLSQRAAQKIGMIKSGTAKVKLVAVR